MIARIFTERKNVKAVKDFVSEEFQGFTIFKTTGYWQGKAEKSLCIEIDLLEVHGIALTVLQGKVKKICQKIKGYNRQECVLVQYIESQTVFVGGN